MVSSINSNINSVQYLNATNAFKASQKSQAQEEASQPKIETGVNITDKEIMANINVEEITQMAMKVGEKDFSESDIKYGLKYGRSVLADYTA